MSHFLTFVIVSPEEADVSSKPPMSFGRDMVVLLLFTLLPIALPGQL
jgi:hypothetical protein